MAKGRAVWGIDIGQCALKALRASRGDDGKLVAEAFDYIEYPKILSQPEANPEELIAKALEEFLSRNTVRGSRVAISVAGQSGLARFIKLPPVESNKIPAIVRYEARQQIPFALEDVVWDYQQLAGGSVEDGFALETEVGLFAMKRDQVHRALKPFTDVGIEVDLVQLTPLALYNFVAFDQFRDLPPPDQYDADNPPESVVVMSLGTDSTDLVVTNGYRVWQRSIPIGGNHFTKGLTKELKLTFAKAEHLKRNAAQAEDPKSLFQAMRSVFSDLLSEVQRSIGYFTNIDRGAKIGRIVALGNAMKLPGLQRYLSQHLGMTVARPEAYDGLTGPGVVDAPAFKENILSFATCYGLAIQGLGQAQIKTNLLPREIAIERLIREKKPWGVAAAALLMVGLTVSCFGGWLALNTVDEESFRDEIAQADQVVSTSQQYVSDFTAAKDQFARIDQVGQHLVHNVEGRSMWLEVLKAVNLCLPSDPPDKIPDDISKREQLFLTSVDTRMYDDLSVWFNEVSKWYQALPPVAAPAAAAASPPAAPGEPAPTPAPEAMGTPDAAVPAPLPPTPVIPPSGPGLVFRITGYHYHNGDRSNEAAQYVRNTLLKNLHQPKISTSDGHEFPVRDLGIAFPVLHDENKTLEVVTIEDPRHVRMDTTEQKKELKLQRYPFTVEFCWKETPPSKRATNAAVATAGQPPVPTEVMP